MEPIFYGPDGKIVTDIDLQNKRQWCADGVVLENEFVKKWGEKFGYGMNPAKGTDPFAPDLMSYTGILTDLKHQHSPFFKSREKFGIDPTYMVVFNVKDRIRYEEKYPDIDIIYHVDWRKLTYVSYGREFRVNYLFGIYRTPFRKLLSLLDRSKVHTYLQRLNDENGNARDSYVFDIRNPIFQQLA